MTLQRPLAYAGFSCFFALIFAVFLGKIGALVVAGLCITIVLCLISVSIVRRKIVMKVIVVALASVSLALTLYGITVQEKVSPYQNLAGQTGTIHGRIMDEAESKYGRYYYVIKVDTVIIKDKVLNVSPFQVRVSSIKAFVSDVYDKVEWPVTFSAFSDAEFGFSPSSYYQSRGILIAAYIKDYSHCNVISTTQKPIHYYIQKLRQVLVQNINEALPREEASLITAMLLGDRSGLSQQMGLQFKVIGASHLLVVSGIHVTAIVLVLSILLRPLRLPARVKTVIMMLGVLLFMAITGFQPSVLRSGIMFLVLLASGLFGRETDSINTLGFTALVMCITNPLIGGDIGYILSVLSTLGILTMSGKISKVMQKPFLKRKWLSKVMYPIMQSIAVSVAAILFTMPVLIFVFREFSLLSPISSLLLVFPTTLLLYCACFFVVFSVSGIVAPAGVPFIFCAGLLAKLIVWISRKLSTLDLFFFGIEGEYALIVLMAILSLTAVFILIKRTKSAYVALYLMSALVLCCGMISYEFVHRDVVRIAIADVGDSGSSVVLMANKQAVVISASGYRSTAVSEILHANNVRTVQSVLLTSVNRDTADAVRNITERFQVETVYLYDAVYLEPSIRKRIAKSSVVSFSDDKLLSNFFGCEIILHGDRYIEIMIQGKHHLTVELDKAPALSSDFLITSDILTKVQSAMTIVQSDSNEITTNRESSYVFTSESKTIYLDFYPNRRVSLGREI